MPSITLILTEVEHLALGAVALSPDEWINNAVHERCRTAINDIVAFTLEKCLANDIQVPGTKDDIVKLAFQQGWVTSAADRPESEGP